LKIPRKFCKHQRCGLSEAVNRKRAYTTMTKRQITKLQTMIDIIIHRKLKTGQQNPTKNGDGEGTADDQEEH